MSNSFDEEAGPLLPSGNEDSRVSERSTYSKSKVAVVALALTGVLLLATRNAALVSSKDEIAHTDFAANMNAFASSIEKSTGNNEDGGIQYLDRHTLDCEGRPISRFQESGRVQITYNCLNTNSLSPLAVYGYDTGDQEYGGIVYLDRQRVNCPDRTFLTYMKGNILSFIQAPYIFMTN